MTSLDEAGKKGKFIVMLAGHPHTVMGQEWFKILLVVIQGGGRFRENISQWVGNFA